MRVFKANSSGFIWIILITTLLGFGLSVHAVGISQLPSAWLSKYNPTLQKQADIPIGSPFSISGNIDCTTRTFVTRTSRTLPAPQTEMSHEACSVQTGFGPMDPNGYLLLNNSRVAGKILGYQDVNPQIIPIPGSTTIMRYSSAPVLGIYLFFTQANASTITPTINSLTGEITYNINRPYDVALRDRSGKLLPVQSESMSFSADGEWMVVDSPFVSSTLRVNLKTFEVLPFAPSFNYNIGIGPNLQTAITSDGRYAVVASRGFNSFKLYDLSTCTNIPDRTINGPAACQSRDLWSFMQKQTANFRSINNLRFIDSNILSLYATYRPQTSNTDLVSKYLLAAPGQSLVTNQYLSLGDSFASGEGAYAYLDGTDTSNNECHLSEVSYPFLISRTLNLDSYHSVACSGARMEDMIDGRDEYLGQTRIKVARRERDIDSILNNFQPGYINQLDFVKAKQPQVVTLSVIGNNVGFADIIKRCVKPGTCYGNYEDRLELFREINSKFGDLTSLYQQLKSAAPPGAQIYIIGYPQLTDPAGDCANNVHLNQQEILFSQQLIGYLNELIASATQNAGVTYINVEQALSGHRLCETRSSDIAVNGLTAGNDLLGVIGKESYHPNQLGHQLLAQAILSKTHGFTLGSSASNSAVKAPTESNQPLLNTPHSGRQVYISRSDPDLTSDIVLRNTITSGDVDGLQYSLKPFTSYHVTMNDGATDLGSTVSDSRGNLSFNFTSPITTDSGYQTINIYGQNLANEPVNIYKTIYIGISPNDYDGDGLLNGTDSCPTNTQSEQDADQDSIDDACDDVIGEAPTGPKSLPDTGSIMGASPPAKLVIPPLDNLFSKLLTSSLPRDSVGNLTLLGTPDISTLPMTSQTSDSGTTQTTNFQPTVLATNIDTGSINHSRSSPSRASPQSTAMAINQFNPHTSLLLITLSIGTTLAFSLSIMFKKSK